MTRKGSRKQRVFAALAEATEAYANKPEKPVHPFCGMSAAEIAAAIGMDRPNVSRELNSLCKKGLVAKTPGRPVRFIPVSHMPSPQQSKPPPVAFAGRTPYPRCRCSQSKRRRERPESELEQAHSVWKALLGADGSLSSQVNQAKAAATYPGGLPILITGPPGSGKTFFASLIHKHCVSEGIVSPDTAFTAFNCADYATNPQLLMSQLFGHAKGAFTGADHEKAGLVEASDGGFLFLDEVHRLPPEGQEMLYMLLDQGTYRRLGESSRLRSATIRLIAATTENPGSALLPSFLRRIPVTLYLPGYWERPIEERLQLIERFFQQEAITLRQSILVRGIVARILASFTGSGNVGELKSVIQVACATSLVRSAAHGDRAPKRTSTFDLNDEECNETDLLTVDIDSLPADVTRTVPVSLWWRNPSEAISVSDCVVSPNRVWALDTGQVAGSSPATPRLHEIRAHREPPSESSENRVRVLVLSYGSGVARGIASFANLLVDADVATGVEVEPGMCPVRLAEAVRLQLAGADCMGGLIVLADTPDIGDLMNAVPLQVLPCRTYVVGCVTTPLVIAAAQKAAVPGARALQIVQSLNAEIGAHGIGGIPSSLLPMSKPDVRRVILTTCLSGTGTAERIKRLLADVFPCVSAAGCDIVALDSESVQAGALAGDSTPISADVRPVACIGTLDPQLSDVPFIPLDELLTETGLARVSSILERSLGIARNGDAARRMAQTLSVESLLEYLTILNPRAAVAAAERFLVEVETALTCSLDTPTRVRVLVHIACMLERLLKGQALSYPEDRQEAWKRMPPELAAALRKAATDLGVSFSTEIPDDEIVIVSEIISPSIWPSA